jgi:hypothetical protein
VSLRLGYGRVSHSPLVKVNRPAALRVAKAGNAITVIDEEWDRVRVGMTLKMSRYAKQTVGRGVRMAVSSKRERTHASRNEVRLLT